MRQLRNFVNGRFVEGDRLFDKLSPVDGSLVARVHEADRETVDRAVRAARSALDGAWGRSRVAERVALLRRIADRARRPRSTTWSPPRSRDTGKPVSLARSLDVPRGRRELPVVRRHRCAAPGASRS